jgi:hypothetical protein
MTNKKEALRIFDLKVLMNYLSILEAEADYPKVILIFELIISLACKLQKKMCIQKLQLF